MAWGLWKKKTAETQSHCEQSNWGTCPKDDVKPLRVTCVPKRVQTRFAYRKENSNERWGVA